MALQGPGGEALAEAGRGPGEIQEVLSLVSAAAGRHRLTVAAGPDHPGGSYRLELRELRPAAAADASRVAAQQAFAEALEVRAQSTQTADEAALRKLQEALELWVAAGEAAGEADALNEIGTTHYNQGDFQAALAAFERALAAAQRGGYRWGEANAHNNLGVARMALRQSDEALGSYQRSLEIWQEVGDSVQESMTLNNLGYFYYANRRDLDRAARAFTQALPLQEAKGYLSGQAGALNGLGIVARDRGDLAEALRLFELALERVRQAGDRRMEILFLGTLASVHRRRGELEEALRLYTSALATGRGDRDFQARLLHDLASLYVDLGDLEKALASYEQALDLFPAEENPDLINALLNIGLVHQELGDSLAALAQYRSALALSRRKGLRIQEALALHYLGKAHLDLDRPAEALGYLEEALRLRREAHELPDACQSIYEIGTAYQELGQPARAAERYEEAIALARGIDNPTLVALALLRRARLDRDLGRLEPARAGIEEALTIVEAQRTRVGADSLRTSFFATMRPFYELYVDLLMRLEDFQPGRGHRAEALAASERARARGLLDLLAEGRIGEDRGAGAEIKRRQAELAGELVTAERRLAAARAAVPADPEEVERLHRELLAIEQRRESLEAEARDRGTPPRASALLDAGEIQAQLDHHTALLEYALGGEVSYLFVVTRDGLASFRLPPAGELKARVRRLRAALERPSRSLLGSYVEEASELYRLVVAPAREALQGRPNLLIAPDGALHLLPFEALLTDPAASRGRPLPDLPFLLREHAITYVPSASALAEFRAARPRPAGDGAAKLFLAFADPLYGAAPSRTGLKAEMRSMTAEVTPAALPPLPRSADEVTGIAHLYPREKVALYLGRDASEERVKVNPLLSKARYLHFATHGFLNEQRPLLSGLALTPGNRPGEDGVLRAYEIFDLDLSADLVVLSACATGLGKEVTGEGLVGLARAFFHAGVPSLVVSLWQVADDSTPGLMVAFYRRLGEEGGKGEALRQAKLATIEAGGRYAHPFYWAPFVLLGDPGQGSRGDRAVTPGARGSQLRADVIF